MNKFIAKKFIVFGLGISGKATIKFLLDNNYQVLASDDNLNSLNTLEKHPNLKIFNNDWNGIEALILAPGIPLYFPDPHPIVKAARKNNCPIICDIELLYKFNHQAKYIGITGTNGKSTTTALTGHIFQENNINSAVGGNIGIPCLQLPRLKASDFYILEMSSFQLDLIHQTKFFIASLLNITPDHIDRHGSMEGYITAKKRIFMNQQKGDFAVIGVDNENSRKVYDELKNNKDFQATLIPISTKRILSDGISVIDGIIHNNFPTFGKNEINLGELPFLKGEHNAQNIAIAFANAFLSGIGETKIINAIKTFKGLGHRMELVGNIDNINFINDSKATNAESTENALKSYKNIYWILGGKAKEGGIKMLEPYFSIIEHAFLMGEASDDFAKTLDGKVEYVKCQTLQNAFDIAYKKALSEKKSKQINILLSPACASFDQWKNFEERGEYFCKLVKELKNEK